ncbi:MAG: fimbrillin family protein [Bacteroidales bacterium]|nr:fimbrillin family protein [Bacteroidales bacterium]
MKKMFLLAAAALVAFASCSKSDVEKAAETKAIGFNGYTGRAVTKANASLIDKGTTELLSGSKFVVYAYNTGSAAWAKSVSDVFMNGVTVTYAGGGKTDPTKYTYTPLRYWPNDEANNKLTFFAYYPQGGTGITAPTNGWGAYSFTAQTDPKNMVDFCLSEVAANQVYSSTNSGTDGVVNMKFYHTLTMVKFQVKTDADYATDGTTITLKSISLAGVKTTGTLTPDNTTAAWSAQAGATALDVCTADKTLSTSAIFVPTGTEKNDAYLMVPQTLGDDVIATIVYEVKTGSDAAVTNTATVQLNTDATVKAWDMNKNIVYTFVVGLKPIKFTAEVADWAAKQDVSFDVN